MIRQLKHGDTIPEGTPRKYVNGSGYVRLRWKVGKREYVEAYEHRVVMGLPPDDVQVHHINEVKDDNRPENLRLISPAEHTRLHFADPRAKAIAEAYRLGAKMEDIAAETGLNHGTVSRIVRRQGVRTRTSYDHKRVPVCMDSIRALRNEGASFREIGEALGVSKHVVRARCAEMGLPASEGRRTKAQRLSARRALHDWIHHNLRAAREEGWLA